MENITTPFEIELLMWAHWSPTEHAQLYADATKPSMTKFICAGLYRNDGLGDRIVYTPQIEYPRSSLPVTTCSVPAFKLISPSE